MKWYTERKTKKAENFVKELDDLCKKHKVQIMINCDYEGEGLVFVFDAEKTGFSEKDVIETINSVIFAQNTPDIILSLKNVVGPFEKMLVDDNRPLKSYHSFIPKPIGRQRRVKR